MNAIDPIGLQKVIVGNDAGWHIAFSQQAEGSTAEKPVTSIGTPNYYAAVEATLPGDLSAGTYKFTFEGMTDDDYMTIKKAKDTKKSTLIARLYLFWRDTAHSAVGVLSSNFNFTDWHAKAPGPEWLVAVLAVTKLSRKAEKHRYSVDLEARELVFHQLASGDKIGTGINVADPFKAAYDLAIQRGVKVAFPKTPPTGSGGSTPADKKVYAGLAPGSTAAEALVTLGVRVQKSRPKRDRFGRGMYLIRDGQLYMGTDRPIPVDASQPKKKLWFKSGLLEYKASGTVKMDPHKLPEDSKPGPKATPKKAAANKAKKEPDSRKQYTLTMKGRPDIKPGDVVQFVPAKVDLDEVHSWAQLGETYKAFFAEWGLSEPDWSKATQLYVSGVKHTMKKTEAFVTEVTGVQVWDGNYWDTWTRWDTDKDIFTKIDPAASPEGRAIHALDSRIRNHLSHHESPDVAEVRAAYTVVNPKSNRSHTLDLFKGLAKHDGEPNQAHRLPIRRSVPVPKTGVAYTSPFAWGKSGLVLPRYPGTRVVLHHNRGSIDDPVEIGALWAADKGPDSKAGDWWLILPSAVPQKERESISKEVVPDPYSGKASNDLIDADGNRVIEIGNLTVRFGPNALKAAGTRPKVGSDGILTIEHATEDAAKKARIVIDQDGNVTIETAKDLNLKAKNVKVTVSENFEVTKG